MNKILNLIIMSVILFSLSACNKVNSDPTKGAKELTLELQKLADVKDYNETNSLLSKYWEAYQDSDKNKFLMALRGELMGNDKVVKFIVSSDFHTYPMCGTYMKNMQDLAYEDALHNLNQVSQSGNDSYDASPASKGILFGSLLANYAETNDKEQAYRMISSTYNNLKKSPELTRIEFFASFQRFIKESGEPGIKAFELMQKLDSQVYYDFMRMSLESIIDYD